MTLPASAADPLQKYRWTKRLVVILAPDASNQAFQQQRTAYEQADGDYREREVVVLQETEAGGLLHRRFHVSGSEFRFLLIGKDGHTALERSAPVSNQELFALIDSMPMRREEMLRRKHL